MTTVCFNYFYIPRNTSMTVVKDLEVGLQEFLLLLLVMAMDCHLSFQQMLAHDGRYCCTTVDVELVLPSLQQRCLEFGHMVAFPAHKKLLIMGP